MVKIDTDRMMGGQAMLDGTRGKGGGIPWFCVRSPDDGATLGDSHNAKGQNIGCPNTDEEIAVFIELMKKVRVNLTDDDVAALKASLIEHRKKP